MYKKRIRPTIIMQHDEHGREEESQRTQQKPDRRLIQDQQCWTILLTTLNNVGSKVLFNIVFISPEQVVRFWLCRRTKH